MVGEMLRLDRVKVENFRCFEQCDVELDPRLTVLVAENGQGKTAVLDAIRIAMRPLVAALAGQRPTHGLRPSDVRLRPQRGDWMESALPMKIGAEGWVGGTWHAWRRTVSRATPKQVWSTTSEAANVVATGARLRAGASSDGSTPPLPLVAYYGTERLWYGSSRGLSQRAAAARSAGRFAPYLDALSSSASFDAFEDWYELMMDEARGPGSWAYSRDERPSLVLNAVRTAVETVLEPTGWTRLHLELAPDGWSHLVVDHSEHGRLPLSWLSDGIRNMVALVGDLAHWCVRLNPQLEAAAARKTPGLLLIDEVDLHLHPSWQQQIVELLQRAFPAMQMVLATHSPHVLSTVEARSIRVIRVRDGMGELETPEFQTRGVESADVLAQIMGVDPVPRVKEAKDLDDYRAMIERGLGESEDAAILRRELEKHFGPTHPVMIDCARLLHFQTFKRERARRKET